MPSLGDSYTKMYNGAVGIFNNGGDGELVSVIEVAKLLGEEGHQHPHVSCTHPYTLSVCLNGNLILSNMSCVLFFVTQRRMLCFWTMGM